MDAVRSAVPGHDEYYMGIAIAVRERANCLGNRVGAIIVVQNRIVSTGYNGTPSDMKNCLDGGCLRCSNREKFVSGTGYDLCICVHAEQNALLSAARFGISVAGGHLYSTMQPCFGCTKEMLQAKIERVFYIHEWTYPDEEVHAEYERIQSRFSAGIRQLDVADPRKSWAVSSKRAVATPNSDDTGHAIP